MTLKLTIAICRQQRKMKTTKVTTNCSQTKKLGETVLIHNVHSGSEKDTSGQSVGVVIQVKLVTWLTTTPRKWLQIKTKTKKQLNNLLTWKMQIIIMKVILNLNMLELRLILNWDPLKSMMSSKPKEGILIIRGLVTKTKLNPSINPNKPLSTRVFLTKPVLK